MTKLAARLAALTALTAAVLLPASGAATVSHSNAPTLLPGHAARCPTSDRAQLQNRNPRANAALVPAGATSLLLCRYYGVNVGARSGTLIASAHVSTSATGVLLAREFDALPRSAASSPARPTPVARLSRSSATGCCRPIRSGSD